MEIITSIVLIFFIIAAIGWTLSTKDSSNSTAEEIRKLRELLEPEIRAAREARLAAEKKKHLEAAQTERNRHPDGRVTLQR